MRTHKEIVADCERAFERLQMDLERRDEVAKKEYERPFNRKPCAKCAYAKVSSYARCAHPLVKGLRPDAGFVDTLAEIKSNAPLCGEEKALWQKRRARPIRIWIAFWDWFLMPFMTRHSNKVGE